MTNWIRCFFKVLLPVTTCRRRNCWRYGTFSRKLQKKIKLEPSAENHEYIKITGLGLKRKLKPVTMRSLGLQYFGWSPGESTVSQCAQPGHVTPPTSCGGLAVALAVLARLARHISVLRPQMCLYMCKLWHYFLSGPAPQPPGPATTPLLALPPRLRLHYISDCLTSCKMKQSLQSVSPQ